MVRQSNIRALWTVLLLGTAFSCAQLVAALVSHSNSLMSDALSMFVDDFAYAMNLAAEYRPDRERAIKIAAPAVSAVLLLGVTAYSISAAVDELGGDEDEEVLGSVVLAFGGANLVFDGAMLCSILLRDRSGAEGAALATRWRGVSATRELNLFSALAHVVADTLRSATQIVVGSLILSGYGGASSSEVDAVGTLVISSIIVVGAARLVYEVGLHVSEWRRSPQPAEMLTE